MRHGLQFTVGPILLGLLAIPQADARGGGGGFGRGVAFRSSNGFHGNRVIRQQRFVRHAHSVTDALAFRQFVFNQFHQPTGFQTFPNIFSGWWGNGFQNGIPTWSGGAWSWPVGGWGGWGWPGDWSGGYAQTVVQPVQAAAPQPQVIVINTDGQGRMTTAEAVPPDYNYMGCHAIPNGYHCDTVAR